MFKLASSRNGRNYSHIMLDNWDVKVQQVMDTLRRYRSLYPDNYFVAYELVPPYRHIWNDPAHIKKSPKWSLTKKVA